jgi:ATP-dependent Clp protease ATP-binding subunit ClpA
MRPKQVKEAIKINLSCNINTLLVGAPAIGKTQVAEQTAVEYCAEHGGAEVFMGNGRAVIAIGTPK